jgi:hypothetical protein
VHSLGGRHPELVDPGIGPGVGPAQLLGSAEGLPTGEGIGAASDEVRTGSAEPTGAPQERAIGNQVAKVGISRENSEVIQVASPDGSSGFSTEVVSAIITGRALIGVDWGNMVGDTVENTPRARPVVSVQREPRRRGISREERRGIRLAAGPGAPHDAQVGGPSAATGPTL